MSVETNGSDYLIVESSTTLIAGTDFPVDRRLVFDVVGGGGGGNSGGKGLTDTSAISTTGVIKFYFGNAGLGGICGEHRTYSFDKNTFVIGDIIQIQIGIGGNGGVPSSESYGSSGYAGTATRILKNGVLLFEASGGQPANIVVLSRASYLVSQLNTRASTGYAGWNTSIPFNVVSNLLYTGGSGGQGGIASTAGEYVNERTGKTGSNGGYGSGGGGGGGGGCLVYHEFSTGYIGGNGGNGGNGFASIRWGESVATSVNKEVFQPSFFTYSQDIGECFYAHMQQKMLAISSYKNDFISTYEDAVKATNSENLYTTINGRQCYRHIGDVGLALLGGGSNGQRVSDFLTNLGYTSEDITNISDITARPDIVGVRVDLTKSESFRAVDLQFIADEMYDYFQRNEITKISISHRENAYDKATISIPSSGISILDSEVNAFTTTNGTVKYTQYLNNGQFCYTPESYYSELNNLVFKKENGTVVVVNDSIRKASLAMILLSSNNFVTPIGNPSIESVFAINIDLNGMNVHEDFRINIVSNFGEIEFQHYAMGTQLDSDTNKKEDKLNYVISENNYKPVFCNLVWTARDYFLSNTGSGILQYDSTGTYIDVESMRSENILDILYTLSQTMTLTVVKEDTNKSFWKTVIAGLMSVVIFVLSAYIAPILKLPSALISTALSYAWSSIMPPPSNSLEFNNVFSLSISTVNDEEDDDTSTSVSFFDAEKEQTKNMYNPYIELRKLNESQFIPYSKGGMNWQQQ